MAEKQGNAKSQNKKEPRKKVRNEFRPGDTVEVRYKIREGGKTRIQPFAGIVIAKKGAGESKTFTVRRVKAGNPGIERIFPLSSPNIDELKVIKKGKVRRAKLYYMRDRKGRKAMEV